MPPSPAYGNRSGEVAFLPVYSLLIGSDSFWKRAAEDIGRARSRLLVQAMTFEGDAAGQAVADAVRQSDAADRRVLVDDYTRVVVSDRFVLSPHYLLSKAFRAEIRATRAMFSGLAAAGIGVRVTNPIAGSLLRYGVRNHKKLIVADDVAYLGGFNFSDHNFAWHDLMLRIEGPGPADFLAGDFDATWRSEAGFREAAFDGLRLCALDGRTNAVGFAPLFEAIEQASERICVVSPYLSFPFVEALAAAARRGIEVELLTPLANNKPMVLYYLLDAARRAGFRIGLMGHMSHLKGMVIDDRLLVLGSTNFDFPSYHSMEEHMALIEDAALIRAFEAEVLAPIRADLLPAPFTPPRWQVLRSGTILRMGGAVVKLMGRTRRTAVDWKD
ncbi:MAG: cardiolipin synthase [Sphingomonadales bacterium]|nr:cardiolipin synthase [Sphingomonadales bacterium]